MDQSVVRYLRTEAHVKGPQRADNGSLFDIFAAEAKTIPRGEVRKVSTGLVLELPPGLFGQLLVSFFSRAAGTLASLRHH